MLAWQKFGNESTPESTGLKGDKLVGNFYVAFDKAYKEEISQLMAAGKTEDEAKKQAPIILEAQEMLLSKRGLAPHRKLFSKMCLIDLVIWSFFHLTALSQ